MMLRYLALAILALTFAATAADDLSRTKTIKMDLYTVSAPATKGWVTKKDKRSKTINIAKTDRASKIGLWIDIIPQEVTGMYATVHTQKWLGDDLVRREHANMVALGVIPGMYKLEDVTKYETDIGGKHGYAMRYRKDVLGEFTEHGYLFVYFPPDFEERGVIYKFLRTSTGEGSASSEPDYTVFDFVIDSFRSRSAR
jgi:hypothetical protein